MVRLFASFQAGDEEDTARNGMEDRAIHRIRERPRLRGRNQETDEMIPVALFQTLSKDLSSGKHTTDVRAGLQSVLAVDKDNVGPPALRLFLCHPAECSDDYLIA